MIMEIMKQVSSQGSVPGDAVSYINLDLILEERGRRGEINYIAVNWKKLQGGNRDITG